MMKNFQTSNNTFVTFQEPDICPICSHSIEPLLISSKLHEFEDGLLFFTAFFECTFCKKSFISSYSLEKENVSGPKVYLNEKTLLYSAPSHFAKQSFPECISANYHSFEKIYNQALEAEHYGLDEIAGIGFRKSLEFLIKDFLILHEGKNEEKVKSTTLGNCINTMIDNPQLKTVATRATWLGNDQTHYEQKYTDNNISDLKRLIKLSVNWIEMIYLTEEAENIEKK